MAVFALKRPEITRSCQTIICGIWEAGHQLGAKIAVDLFFVGRTDKVETMAGPRKI